MKRGIRVLVLVAVSCALVPATASASAASCRPDADDLRVTFQPVQNSSDASGVSTRLTLANRGRCALPAADWELLFSSVRRPLATLPPSPANDAARRELADQHLTIEHADTAASGDYYVLKPTAGFEPIAPWRSRDISVTFEFWIIFKSDAPSGFHMSFDGETPRWVPAKSLLDPTDPKQTTAFSGDVRPVQTAQIRFAENTTAPRDLSLQERIVPRPLRATEDPGSTQIGARTRIRHGDGLRDEADYLESALHDVVKGGGGRSSRIDLRVDAGLDVDDDGTADEQGYRLTVSRDRVEIVGQDEAAVLYGIQTLRQMIPVPAYKAAASGARAKTVDIPRARIADAPLFPQYRGLHIDVGRHFETKRTILKFLDLMSFLKLNRLHFHITEDEGWRLQIPGLPELTDFGARRGADRDEDEMLHMFEGSGNDLGGGDGILGKPDDRTEANLGREPRYQGFEQFQRNLVGKGSGFYTTDDYVEILRYADERHIQVFPEFDLPAHSRAAVQAMERRFQRFEDSDPFKANEFRLIDPDDESQHTSNQNYTDNVVNPCVEGTYRFLTKVVTEVKRMYNRAGAPLGLIHLGGDESPAGTWERSPACQGRTHEEVKNLFFPRWAAIARTVAPLTGGWEDVLAPVDTSKLRLDDFWSWEWQSVPDFGAEQEGYKQANRGTPVVMAAASFLYMDLATNKDPNEPGYYWANVVDDRTTFEFQPFDIYANMERGRWGQPFPPTQREELTPEGRENIVGIQASLWGENGRTPELREYQAFPKLLGAAERAWDRNTPTPEQMPAAWDVFANTVGQVTMPLLSFYQPVGLRDVGVNYRIPLPGGRIEDGVLSANVRNPGLAIEYSLDGERWQPFAEPVRVGASALLRTRAPDGRTSRVSLVDVPAWSTGVAYDRGALVTYRGELFSARQGHTSQSDWTPDVTPALWAQIQ